MIVGLVSAYRDTLTRHAIRSLYDCCDKLVVFEGPAGEPLEDEFPGCDYERDYWASLVEVKHGAWKTDAAKRTAMIEYCRRFRDEPPVWGIWLDSDEVLVNGEYLRDHLDVLNWEDENLPLEGKYMGWPVKIVERDGTMVVARGRVLRVDLVDSYSVSSSVFKNALGFTHGEGHVLLRQSEWTRRYADALAAIEDPGKRAEQADRVIIPPPFPCEPFLVHRPHLRHPLRRGLRLSDQEAVELRKAGLLD